MKDIQYKINLEISASQFADIFNRAGLKRPTNDLARMATMLQHADILVTAWGGEQLVGVARSLSDYAFCCYMSDLAVDKDYQHHGIGKQMIKLTQDEIGPKTTLLLLAAPSAMEYYPRVGFEAVPNGWTIHRTE